MKQIIKHKKITVFFTLLILGLICVILIYKSRYQEEVSPYSQQEMKKAIVYFNQSEEYEKALVLAKEYVSLYPEDQEGWVHRGVAYLGLVNCAEATSDFTHASMNGNEDGKHLLSLVLEDKVCNK